MAPILGPARRQPVHHGQGGEDGGPAVHHQLHVELEPARHPDLGAHGAEPHHGLHQPRPGLGSGAPPTRAHLTYDEAADAGEDLLMQDAGGVHMKLEDEYGGMRNMNSRVMDVHKNLTSASVAAKAGTNSWLTEGGGYMLPRSCEANRKIEKILEAEASKPQSKMLPLYEERGVYNFYLKVGKKGSIAPLEEAAPAKPPSVEVKALLDQIKKLDGESMTALCQELPGFPGQPCA